MNLHMNCLKRKFLHNLKNSTAYFKYDHLSFPLKAGCLKSDLFLQTSIKI